MNQTRLAETQVSDPATYDRYKFAVILIIILVIIYVMNPENLRPQLDRINVKGLIAYLIIIAILFAVCMKIKMSDNWWDVAHFLFYFGLAKFVPHNWVIVATVMVAWEIFEDFRGFNQDKPEYIETDRKKMVDMLANSSGYYLGNILWHRDYHSFSK